MSRFVSPREYPATVEECLNDNARYKPAVLAAMRAYRRSKPWRGTLAERRRKLKTLHEELCRMYRLQTGLAFTGNGEGDSGASCYIPMLNRIVLHGKVSVVTYLHEFAHARFGSSERKACTWSLNLFRRMFPRSWERLRFEGHVVRSQRG